MADWTTCRVTPETLAELRRLLEEATPGPWHAWDRGIGYEVHTEVEHNPIHCVSLNSEFRETFRGPDARLIAAAVNALPALLDAAAERDALAAAWDEGHQAGHKDARAVQSTYPEPTPNPYRAEGEPHA